MAVGHPNLGGRREPLRPFCAGSGRLHDPQRWVTVDVLEREVHPVGGLIDSDGVTTAVELRFSATFVRDRFDS